MSASFPIQGRKYNMREEESGPGKMKLCRIPALAFSIVLLSIRVTAFGMGGYGTSPRYGGWQGW
jgi:hypothetical protein